MRKLTANLEPDEQLRITLAEAAAMLPTPEGKRSAAVFEHGTLQVKLYAPRGTDPQKPHTRDEAYVVARGTGVARDHGGKEGRVMRTPVTAAKPERRELKTLLRELEPSLHRSVADAGSPGIEDVNVRVSAGELPLEGERKQAAETLPKAEEQSRRRSM